MLRRVMTSPIFVVTGPTAVGKSKLAVELAKRFGGECINSDAMQVYDGLDIITNKVTPEEADGVPHHLLGYIHPFKTNHTVIDYRTKVLSVIDKLNEENKVPVVVGGTNYYNEAILFDMLVPSANTKEVQLDPYPQLSTEDLLARLHEVDGESARELHPNERRKIARALQIFDQTGVKRSTHMKAQHEEGLGKWSGGCRFSRGAILWLDADRDVLRMRILERVFAMINNGIVDELDEFRERYLRETGDQDFKHGIFQAIGLRQFASYLKLTLAQRESKEGARLRAKATEHLYNNTCQYAKSQSKWIKNRLVARGDHCLPVYRLDATDLVHWQQNVAEPALEIVAAVLRGDTPSHPRAVPDEAPDDEVVSRVCAPCGDRIFVLKSQWEDHLRSRGHQKRVAKLRKNLNGEEPEIEGDFYLAKLKAL